MPCLYHCQLPTADCGLPTIDCQLIFWFLDLIIGIYPVKYTLLIMHIIGNHNLFNRVNFRF